MYMFHPKGELAGGTGDLLRQMRAEVPSHYLEA